MIAGVNGTAVLAALLILLPCLSRAADDSAGALRELAKKTATFAGRGEPVSISWRNLSPLATGDFNQARDAFDGALREAGVRPSEVAPVVEARITLSANPAQYVLVEEARKGEERQVWMAFWKRPVSTQPAGGLAVTLEKKLLWEQDEQILDAVPLSPGLLVLSPSQVSLHADGAAQAAPLTPPRAWPRDLRGHLRVNGGGFRVYLPGMACAGTVAPSFSVECHPSDEPWTVDAGTRGILLAGFAAGRNHFDGHLAVAGSARKAVTPFYSAVPVEESGRPYWMLSLVDGRTQILDAAWAPVGSVAGWGSDLAGAEARCGGSLVLATKAGEAKDPDAIRAYRLVNRAPVALSGALEFSGPVTALWSLGGNAAMAVVNDLATGHYQAYLVTVNCGG